MTAEQRGATTLLDRGEVVEVALDTLLREFDDCPQCGTGKLDPIIFYDDLGREVEGLICEASDCEWRGLP